MLHCVNARLDSVDISWNCEIWPVFFRDQPIIFLNKLCSHFPSKQPLDGPSTFIKLLFLKFINCTLGTIVLSEGQKTKTIHSSTIYEIYNIYMRNLSLSIRNPSLAPISVSPLRVGWRDEEARERKMWMWRMWQRRAIFTRPLSLICRDMNSSWGEAILGKMVDM